MTGTKNKSPLLKRKSIFNMVSLSVFTMVSTFMLNVMFTFAATTDLGTKIKNAMETFYSNIKDAFDAAAVAALAIALFFLLFGRSDQSAQKSYSAIFKIGIAFVVFHSLFWLVPWVGEVIGANSTYTPSNINAFPIINNIQNILIL